jgi:hypothetical protein
VELGEDLISLVCLVLNAIALVRCRRVENLDAIECGVVGVFIAPTTKNGRWKCAVAWRTGQSGAPATSADRWGSTVGALTCGASGLSGAPTAHPLTSARAGAHLMHCSRSLLREVAVAPLAYRIVRCAPDTVR